MEMMIRELAFFVKFVVMKWKYRKQIWFRGIPVIYAFPGSSIRFNNVGGGKINVFSHPLSNMIGLPHRCILVAKHGGKIEIGEGVCMSGCTLYAMDSISVGRNTDIGSGCKIIDNDFHPLPYSQRHPVEQLDKVKKRPIRMEKAALLGLTALF